jgi:hypothetical protein
MSTPESGGSFRSPKGDRLTDAERQQIEKLFGNWFNVPADFKSAMMDYIRLTLNVK